MQNKLNQLQEDHQKLKSLNSDLLIDKDQYFKDIDQLRRLNEQLTE